MPKLTRNQVKNAVLEGRKVSSNNWEISVNDHDEVVIFPPKGDGFATTLAYLDHAIDDYCKKAGIAKPGSKPKRSEVKVGPDSETQNLLKSPTIKKRDVPSGGVIPDMASGSEDDHPFTPKPRDKSPEVGPAPEADGGMPSEDLGPDSEGDIKWGRIRDTFMDESSPTDFYRELKAKKPSAELLQDITNERKWVANNRVAEVPEKWEKTVKEMKDKPEIDNPFALANWMEQQGYTPGGKDKRKSEKRQASPKQDNYLANLGDVDWAKHGGLLVFDSSHGPYAVSVQPWGEMTGEVDFDSPEHEWLVYEFPIEKFEIRGGTLVDERGHEPWFVKEDLDNIASTSGRSGGELAQLLTSDNPIDRAEGYDLIGAYGGFDEFADQEYLDREQMQGFLGGIEGVDFLKESKKSYKQAGPKLREKWDDKGSYHRDIEAESPEELHALTKAFGGEDIDWSSFKQEAEPIEAEDDMGEVVAQRDAKSDCMKESEMDMEAVDETAKEYWEDYYKDDDYGKKMVKDDVTDKRKRDKDKKDEKKAQAALPPKQPQPAPQVTPAGPQAPAAAPAAPPAEGAPGAPKPGAPGAGMKPGTGDAGLQALGWTPEDIQYLDEEDKQKILQIQLNKPGTKQPKPAPQAPPKGGPGAAPGAPGGAPAPAAPQAPGQTPMPQKPMPTPIAYKMGKALMKKIKFRKAQQMLTQEPFPQAAPPQAPAAPVPNKEVMPEFQQGEAVEETTNEQKAFQILSEVQQMPVQATTPESVPSLKAQELTKRLLTEIGMSIEEAKQLFGVSKTGQGLITLFR